MCAILNVFAVDCQSDIPHFECDRDNCLEYRFLCNGIRDCRNATDEKNCGKYSRYYSAIHIFCITSLFKISEI